jgi:quercetin dioxygenase-like cupin family protein
MTDADEIDLGRLTGRLPARFGARTVELAPTSVLAYDATGWRDAIVFVTAGEVEVECTSGVCGRFRQGDILCLAPFPVRVLRNTGTAPARLLAIWRAHSGTG